MKLLSYASRESVVEQELPRRNGCSRFHECADFVARHTPASISTVVRKRTCSPALLAGANTEAVLRESY